jgi:hypothetical protein
MTPHSRTTKWGGKWGSNIQVASVLMRLTVGSMLWCRRREDVFDCRVTS